mmetsp:Transcript_37018/g.49073  ORF Transcript_37018/g.49073 Transcript_37018/m.49073 type:complete len:207 (-) Transcript_37018:373-993(-)
MSHGLKDEEIADYKEAFGMFDIDGDGTITLSELQEIMKSLGSTSSKEELTAMVKSVDVNGDGEIDFEEFLVLMKSQNKDNDPDRDLRKAFNVFDKDGSGSISQSELKELMQQLGQKLSDQELAAMMSEVDSDGNGEIDFEEFKNMMVSQRRATFHFVLFISICDFFNVSFPYPVLFYFPEFLITLSGRFTKKRKGVHMLLVSNVRL